MSEHSVPHTRPLRVRFLRAGQPDDRATDLLPGHAVVAAAEPDRTLLCAHAGSSMNPTLCEMDLLEIVPYVERSPRAGDVILFRQPGGEQLVVHRVVRVTDQGLRTRGDSNSGEDAYTLAPGEVIGRVAAAWRGQQRRPIRGGRPGQIQALWVRWLRAADPAVSAVLHPLYRGLSASALLHPLLPARLRPRVVRFAAAGQGQLRLLLGRRVVGQYDPDRERWEIRRPYRLLIDESSLPRPASPT